MLKKTIGIASSLILTASIVGGTSVLAFQNQEVEPNNNFIDATQIKILQDTTVDTVGGSLQKGDQDYFQFELKSRILDFTISENSIHYEDRSLGLDSSPEINVELYDKSHQLVKPDRMDDGIIFDSLDKGTYYISVTDALKQEEEIPYSIYFHSSSSGVYRFSGQDRYETAVDTAQNLNYGYHAFLASGEKFPDALAGSPLQSLTDSPDPLLLVKKDSIPQSVENSFNHFNTESVTILGGPSAISEEVETYLENELNLEVNRIFGQNRYETAAAIAEELRENFPYGLYAHAPSDKAFVVSGEDFPDALSAGSVSFDSPILLTKKNELPEATREQLKHYNEVYVVGGPAVISDEVVNSIPNAVRIYGQDRYETSLEVVKEFRDRTATEIGVNIATGENFADALVGGSTIYPVILTKPDQIPVDTQTYLKDINRFNILGGPNAISEKIEEELWTIVESHIE
ncbi:cell wall-binding repeat-containing protein [Bacillus carboniphilus]|uniref:Cell wall-binding repeat-containing protein n=1 Tax=Bacillus carboniphilus TaxID=86663 RepID=A0ABY9JTC9_9BACI|nr:cell wall-binding repeat-containing protein [Bacillus carboniphilus]WLR42652.1 cell wall-binding repeat-containing protein [Bacillus carboniphilus]